LVRINSIILKLQATHTSHGERKINNVSTGVVVNNIFLNSSLSIYYAMYEAGKEENYADENCRASHM
jgi:hypothetical protein